MCRGWGWESLHGRGLGDLELAVLDRTQCRSAILGPPSSDSCGGSCPELGCPVGHTVVLSFYVAMHESTSSEHHKLLLPHV